MKASIASTTRLAGLQLADPPPMVKSEECAKAHLILRYAHDTCNSMLKTFRLSLEQRGRERGTPRGAPTDEQMDLLRAMLVFAGAGLDSMLKQLIRDALPALSTTNDDVRLGLETFTARKLRGYAAEEASRDGSRFLASVVISESPRDTIIEAYVQDLTGGSLQSPSELSRSLSALGLSPGPLLSFYTWLGEAFEVRNQIVHELDINFQHPKRNRQTRPVAKMVDLTNDILRVSAHILALIDERVQHSGGA